MYLLGEGVPADRLEAYHWFALASAVRDDDDEQVHATASFLLEEVSAKLTPDQISQAKQRISEWKPAPSASRQMTSRRGDSCCRTALGIASATRLLRRAAHERV